MNLIMVLIQSIRLQNYMYGQRDAGFFGYSHFTGGFPGGQAEYVRVSIIPWRVETAF